MAGTFLSGIYVVIVGTALSGALTVGFIGMVVGAII